MPAALRYHSGVEPDVVVIGAGIIGCAVARELALRRARVVVLEASAIAAGATQSSAGVLAPYIEAPARGPLL
ncbi:MAG TPA: FAD-dependent oxidoreductase, partial [Vicinamibacterales bacterium]